MIRHYAQAIASEYGKCMVRAEDLGLAPASLARIKQLKSEIDHGIRRLLEEGAVDGSIDTHDPKMTAFALAGALNWIAHWYREEPVDERRRNCRGVRANFQFGADPAGRNGPRADHRPGRDSAAQRAASSARPKT